MEPAQQDLAGQLVRHHPAAQVDRLDLGGLLVLLDPEVRYRQRFQRDRHFRPYRPLRFYRRLPEFQANQVPLPLPQGHSYPQDREAQVALGDQSALLLPVALLTPMRQASPEAQLNPVVRG